MTRLGASGDPPPFTETPLSGQPADSRKYPQPVLVNHLARERWLSHAARALAGSLLRVDPKDEPSDLPPVGALSVGVEQPQVGEEVAEVVVRQLVTGGRLVGNWLVSIYLAHCAAPTRSNNNR